MADYLQMYRVLFQAVTRTIEILQEAQQTTEEIYISADEPVITLLPRENGNENGDGSHS